MLKVLFAVVTFVLIVGGLPYKKFAKILSSQIKIKFIMFLRSSTFCFIAGRSHNDFMFVDSAR